jgi:hypothetical protein
MGRRLLRGTGAAGMFPGGPAMPDIVARVHDTLVRPAHEGRG